VRFFFEEEAFDAAGRPRQPTARSINKLGHALHDLDPICAGPARRYFKDGGILQPSHKPG
jgi:phytanoyl-CoA hydroxylase